MGVYLNSTTAYTLYKSEMAKPYFVDKTAMLKELFPLVEEGNSYICVTRPRRFGKTVTANMIAAFFSQSNNTTELFSACAIRKELDCPHYQNQYPVIHISFHDLPKRCDSYEDYISRIEKRMIRDLRQEYPMTEIEPEEAVWDILTDIYAEDENARFVFVLDEWDFIFHQDFAHEKDKKAYLLFLRNLLKDRPYVRLAYITGILPIAKYSSGSELNMFVEYTMVTEEKFSSAFGFTEMEVDGLYKRYLENTENVRISREELKEWYNGYHTFSGERVYNPRSVVCALRNNNPGNYWTSSGPHDEIYYYIQKNIAEVRDDLVRMSAGFPVQAKVREYAASSMRLQTRDEIFSAMVVYGFLSYENGKVSIPNRELMERFDEMLQKESSLGYVNRLAKESVRMLEATLAGDTETMCEILEMAHNTEVPLLHYNNETELTAIVNLVYLAARDQYRIEREEKAGIGYVDFIFYPELDKSADCIILELKIDHSPEEAIRQIREKQYDLRFRGYLGKESEYTGKIRAVGIGYDWKSKKHSCKVEIF